MNAGADDDPRARDDGTPAELRGLMDFLNSRASARRPERFNEPSDAAAFLSQCDLGYDGRDLSAADVARLRDLRDALMRALEEPADPLVWTAVNDAASSVPMRLQTTAGPIIALAANSDNPADAVIATILGQLTNAAITCRWARFGACARCRRVFYDATRSHTRRWCSYATCGNRVNVAAYRSRTRHQPPT